MTDLIAGIQILRDRLAAAEKFKGEEKLVAMKKLHLEIQKT